MSRYGPRCFSLYPSRVYHSLPPAHTIPDGWVHRPVSHWTSTRTAEKHGLKPCKRCWLKRD